MEIELNKYEFSSQILRPAACCESCRFLNGCKIFRISYFPKDMVCCRFEDENGLRFSDYSDLLKSDWEKYRSDNGY